VPNGRDNKPPIQQQQQQQQQQQMHQQRILPPLPPPLPPPVAPMQPIMTVNNNNNHNNHNNNNNIVTAEPSPKKLRRTDPTSEPRPPTSPKSSNFTKGSLIRLANGNIKKVEDMRIEDFVNSVKSSDLHRIDPSTVVRIEPVTGLDTAKGNIKITLSYGDQRSHLIGGDNKKTLAAPACKSQQVEMESGAEHPYFVFGRGWASWSPDKTLAKYGLTCQRLQVGDVCVSLTKRTSAAAVPATTAAASPHGKRRHQHLLASVAAHQQQNLHQPQHHHHHHQQQQQQHHSLPHHPAVQKVQQLQADDDKNGRNKRRWSAPDPEAAT